jgi:tetratricopeptide (TPR) repeat protein
MAAMLLLAGIPQGFAHGTHSSLMSIIDARLAEAPENGKLWYQRALLEFEHEDWAASATDFEKAERFAPGEYPVLWWQGQILDKLGKTEEAKKSLDEFLAIKPDHWSALASRARVETQLGLHEQALADFRSSLANNPKAEPDLFNEVAQALANREMTDEALATVEAGITRLGPIPALQSQALDIEVDACRWDAALARLDVIRKSALRPEPWMMKRAGILAAAGRVAESRAAWQALVRHLTALPPGERDSHSMMLISEQAQIALTTLASSSSGSGPFPGFSTLRQP